MTGDRQSVESVWDALADTPAQAANMRLRAQLARQVLERVRAHGWTPAEAARRAGITAPRMSDLVRGRLSRFSLDALVEIAERLGARVVVRIEGPA